MIKPAFTVFRISLYTYFFHLLTPTLALPTLGNSGDDSGSVGRGSSQLGSFTSQILINGQSRSNGTLVSMVVTPHAFSFASLPPIEDSPNIDYHDYRVEDISSLTSADGEEDAGANERKGKDEKGMLVTSAQIRSGPAGTRCILFFPYKPLLASSSAPRSTSEAISSTELETSLESECDSEDTQLYRFTSPIFTSGSPLTYSQSTIIPQPTSSPSTRQPLSDPASERANALICYVHPYPSPSSYPFNYPMTPTIMPIAVLLLEYTHPDTEKAFHTQTIQGQGRDVDLQYEPTGGLDLLMLDLYQSGSARHAFTQSISRSLGKVRGIKRAVVLEQGESTAENGGKKVVCRFEKGNSIRENRQTGLLWGDVDAEDDDDDNDDEGDDWDWDDEPSTSNSEWEWDVVEDTEEEDGEDDEDGEDGSSLPSFSLDEALQTPVHGVRAVMCAYE